MNKTTTEDKRVFFERLGFCKYKQRYIDLYRLDLPTQGTYLLANKEGALWIEYEDNSEYNSEENQSVGFGEYSNEQINNLVNILMSCK